MYRWDARTIVSLIILVTWFIPLYSLIRNYADKRTLEAKDAELGEEIEYLKAKYDELSSNLMRSSDSITSETKNLAGDRAQERLVNIFIETGTEGRQASIKKQFYKTFGSTSSGALFENVKKLPEHLRKRVLVTGGAGFVGEYCKQINMIV